MDNSETSTAEEEFLSERERNVRIFATQMLKNRIFLGQYQERRRVDSLQAYRDVIVVNTSETNLKNDLNVVRERLRNYYGPNCWIGLTDPNFIGAPTGHCIWIESGNDNMAFGNYWYKIKGVRFKNSEVKLRLKIIRAMTDADCITHPVFSNISSSSMTIDQIDWQVLFENVKNYVLENLVWFFTVVLTAQNTRAAVTFVSVLIATLFTFLLKGLEYLMEFSLRFMREFSYFIHCSTPTFIAVINMIGKIFGGFYLLIAMMWRDTRAPAPPRSQLQSFNNYRALPMPNYRSRSRVAIQEIE